MTLRRVRTAATLPSANRPWPCGGIFDAPSLKSKLQETEEQTSAPGFWNQPEKSQKIMQQRKRLEESLGNEQRIAALTDDLDTLFELAREGETVNGDIERDLETLRAVRRARGNRHAALR